MTSSPITTSPSASTHSNPQKWMVAKRGRTHRRVRHLLDRMAGLVVWVGGLATIVSILGIFVYLVWEVIPLFQHATASLNASIEVNTQGEDISNPQTMMVGIDEYQEVPFVLEGTHLQFFSLPNGNPLEEVGKQLSIDGEPISVVRMGATGNSLSLATVQGLVYPVRIAYRPVFQNEQRTIVPRVTVKDPVQVVPEGHSIILHTHVANEDDTQWIAALTDSGELWLTRLEEPGEFSFEDEVTMIQHRLNVPADSLLTSLALSGVGRRLVAGTKDGQLLVWEWQREGYEAIPQSLSVSASGTAVTVVGYVLGERTLVIGTASGEVNTWMPSDGRSFESVKAPFRLIHTFTPHAGSVTALSVSQRDKGFLTADNQGTVLLHHSTSGQTIVEMDGTGGTTGSLYFAPKGNGAVWLGTGGTLRSFAIHNPHPEVTMKSLLFPVTYEGYDRPEIMWQSSSGSDEFEPKLGLMPLMFGTLKGTIYA
ncbi:MAG: hypothetical protein V3U07_09030, partial [Nitrospirales bacterium]